MPKAKTRHAVVGVSLLQRRVDLAWGTYVTERRLARADQCLPMIHGDSGIALPWFDPAATKAGLMDLPGPRAAPWRCRITL